MSSDQTFRIKCIDNANTPESGGTSLTSGDVQAAIECRLRACGDLRKVVVEGLSEKLTPAQDKRVRYKMHQWASLVDEIIHSDDSEMAKGGKLTSLVKDMRDWSLK